MFGHFVCQSAHVSQLQHYADAVGPTSLHGGAGDGAALAAVVASANGAAGAAAASSAQHSSLNKSSRVQANKGPGWGIIVGFTLAFVSTYPLHMYVAEVYLLDNFAFLLTKYCAGFLFVLFVPLITLALEKEIRRGIRSVFGSAVLCLQDMAEAEAEGEAEEDPEASAPASAPPAEPTATAAEQEPLRSGGDDDQVINTVSGATAD